MFRMVFSSFLLLSTFMFGLYNVGQTVSLSDQDITFDVCNGSNPQTGGGELKLADLNGDLNGGQYYVFHIDMAASW